MLALKNLCSKFNNFVKIGYKNSTSVGVGNLRGGNVTRSGYVPYVRTFNVTYLHILHAGMVYAIEPFFYCGALLLRRPGRNRKRGAAIKALLYGPWFIYMQTLHACTNIPLSFARLPPSFQQPQFEGHSFCHFAPGATNVKIDKNSKWHLLYCWEVIISFKIFFNNSLINTFFVKFKREM